MSANTYSSEHLELTLVKDVAMRDSQSKSSGDSSLEQALLGCVQGDLPKDSTANILDGIHNEDTIEFGMEDLFCIPPSLSCPINEEFLQTDVCPFALWATLKLAIQENPVNPADVVFHYLADFTNQAMEEDKHFAIFFLCAK